MAASMAGSRVCLVSSVQHCVLTYMAHDVDWNDVGLNYRHAECVQNGQPGVFIVHSFINWRHARTHDHN